jgi:hypothetical protein
VVLGALMAIGGVVVNKDNSPIDMVLAGVLNGAAWGGIPYAIWNHRRNKH